MKKIVNHLKENWIRHGFETLVVVVGILVAFTMNNWNEERKTKEFEREILNDIKTSMQSNFYQLNLCINSNTKHISSCKIILNHINENLPYNDSLDVHFSSAISWCSPTFKNAGYESLKSYGNHTITNDSIRAGLGIYDAGWMETLAARQEEYFYGTASPILTDLFETVAMRTEMKQRMISMDTNAATVCMAALTKTSPTHEGDRP